MVDKPMGSVIFVLHTHLPWVLGQGRWPHGESWLYEAAAECYVPLLQMLDRLSNETPDVRLTLGMTPVLTESLASPRFRDGFRAYLEERRDQAEKDREDYHVQGDASAERLAVAWSTFYRTIRTHFEARNGGDLLAGFRRLQDVGLIEIITSAATHGYLPLLGRDESVAAQIRCGISSYRRHFGRAPRGMWLPECAYRPRGAWSRPVGPARSWTRSGLEDVLARHQLRYFFVDTHLVAGGVPLGTYDDRFEERRLDATAPARGFSPNEAHALMAEGGRRRVAVLARDPGTSVQVWSADYGYPGDGTYLEFHRKKRTSGLRYWRITDRHLPLESKLLYDPKDAEARVRAHAEHFTALVRQTLANHRERTGRSGVVVAPFDTELFGHWWFEGPLWLEAVLRELRGDVDTRTASEYLERHPPRTVVSLPEGSWGQGGYHWVWLNEGTRWVWELVYRAEDAFAEALRSVGVAPHVVDQRILRQLARELLLLEASDWPFLITTVAARDYAEARVRLHFETFEWLLGLAGRTAEGSISAEDLARLSQLEERDSLFPEIDLRWWVGEPPSP